MDKPTRVAVDLLAAAAVEGARQSRSAKQQLDYWARVGRAVTLQDSPTRRRAEAAVAGELPWTALTREEAAVANARIDAGIELRATATSFGRHLAAEGVTTVSLDDDGNLVEHRPDGTSTALT